MDLHSRYILNNNIEIPVIGLGTFLSKPGESTYNAVRYALDFGYRQIDTAAFYQNEGDVGRAVRDSKITREDIFITTKLWNSDQGYSNAIRAYEASMKKLDLGYIDLYLIHWPQQGTREESWRALEKIYNDGGVNSIGVSNYTIKHLEEMKNYAEITPAINQVEFHIYLYQKELLDYCTNENIYIQAYSPLVRGKKFKIDTLNAIAEKYSKTPAQIMLRWTIDVGTITLPKSVNEQRIIENASIFDFELSSEDRKFLDSLNEDYRIAWDPSKID
jgi:diketogulonate reductase-like aldo/keto reductase